MERIERHERKKYLMVDDTILGNVLDKIKKIIGIEIFDDIKILIGVDNKLPDDISLKNVVIWMTYVIKDADQFLSTIIFEISVSSIKLVGCWWKVVKKENL